MKLRRRNRPSSIGSIKQIVPSASAGTHGDWIEFLQRNDGAVPEANEFDVGADNGSSVLRFYSAREAEATQRQFSDRISKHLLPIADAEGGNYVCLGLSVQESGVLFWDHETEEVTQIAPSFTKFLEALRPFDPDAVQLSSDRVVSAWIDPALLEVERNK